MQVRDPQDFPLWSLVGSDNPFLLVSWPPESPENPQRLETGEAAVMVPIDGVVMVWYRCYYFVVYIT